MIIIINIVGEALQAYATTSGYNQVTNKPKDCIDNCIDASSSKKKNLVNYF